MFLLMVFNRNIKKNTSGAERPCFLFATVNGLINGAANQPHSVQKWFFITLISSQYCPLRAQYSA